MPFAQLETTQSESVPPLEAMNAAPPSRALPPWSVRCETTASAQSSWKIRFDVPARVTRTFDASPESDVTNTGKSTVVAISSPESNA